MRDTSSLPDDNSFKSANTALQALVILNALSQRLSISTAGIRDLLVEEVAEVNLASFVQLMQSTTDELSAWLALSEV